MVKKISLLIPVFITAINLFGQTTDIVKCDSIIHPIHQANIGKIAFTTKIVPIEKFKQTDFLTTFELSEKHDLNINVFLANSLTNYLHLFAPQLSLRNLLCEW